MRAPVFTAAPGIESVGRSKEQRAGRRCYVVVTCTAACAVLRFSYVYLPLLVASLALLTSEGRGRGRVTAPVMRSLVFCIAMLLFIFAADTDRYGL